MQSRTDTAFVLDTRTVLVVLLGTTAFFALLSDALQALFYLGPNFPLRDFVVYIFDVNFEKSVPTVFNYLLHLACAITVLLVTLLRRRASGSYEWRWILLALLFVYTSFDEILVLHERIGVRLQEHFHPTGALFYAWVVPGAAFALLVGILELKLVMGLPPPIRKLAIASACVFLGGALGVEMLGSEEFWEHMAHTLRLELLASLEEAMEMSGLSLFIYAMLRYVQEYLGGMGLVLPPRAPGAV